MDPQKKVTFFIVMKGSKDIPNSPEFTSPEFLMIKEEQKALSE